MSWVPNIKIFLNRGSFFPIYAHFGDCLAYGVLKNFIFSVWNFWVTIFEYGRFVIVEFLSSIRKCSISLFSVEYVEFATHWITVDEGEMLLTRRRRNATCTLHNHRYKAKNTNVFVSCFVFCTDRICFSYDLQHNWFFYSVNCKHFWEAIAAFTSHLLTYNFLCQLNTLHSTWMLLIFTLS